jgi:protein-L-isoaspartate(D-aspartate) O-methyltransferase
MSNLNPVEAQFSALRQSMVGQVASHASLVADKTGKDMLGAAVMSALGRVPRHEFVPVEMKLYAYLDSPLPIGFGKTISQPFIVGLMTDLLELNSNQKVLEIGTGLGYQAAVLAELALEVYTVEIVEELAEEGKRRLDVRGYKNIHFRVADGNLGWPEHAPFDRIIATAAPDLMPPALLGQLKPGGRMIIPAGLEDDQQLLLVEKDENGRIDSQEILPVRFSPLTSPD